MQTNNPEKHGESPVVRYALPLPIFFVFFFVLKKPCIYLQHIMSDKKLTIYEMIVIRVMILDKIDEYKQRAISMNREIDEDMDYDLYYDQRINELQEIYNKL